MRNSAPTHARPGRPCRGGPPGLVAIAVAVAAATPAIARSATDDAALTVKIPPEVHHRFNRRPELYLRDHRIPVRGTVVGQNRRPWIKLSGRGQIVRIEKIAEEEQPAEKKKTSRR